MNDNSVSSKMNNDIQLCDITAQFRSVQLATLALPLHVVEPDVFCLQFFPLIVFCLYFFSLIVLSLYFFVTLQSNIVEPGVLFFSDYLQFVLSPYSTIAHCRTKCLLFQQLAASNLTYTDDDTSSSDYSNHFSYFNYFTPCFTTQYYFILLFYTFNWFSCVIIILISQFYIYILFLAYI